jgi:hypothetical protein
MVAETKYAATRLKFDKKAILGETRREYEIEMKRLEEKKCKKGASAA